MNEQLKELVKQAGLNIDGYGDPIWGCLDGNDAKTQFLKKFAELLLADTLNVMRQEWYDLNNAPAVENESPRDVGFRVGKKSEINVLMAKISKHFGVTE